MKKSFVFGCISAFLALAPSYSYARTFRHGPHRSEFHAHHVAIHAHHLAFATRNVARLARLHGPRLRLTHIRRVAAERKRPEERLARLAGYEARFEPSAARAVSGSVIRASYYDTGARTADGERFNPGGFTAAHRTLPFGTKLRLTNESNGRSVTVRVNDRGPFVAGRSLDVSRGAAVALGMIGSGTANLRMQRV